MMTDPSRIFVDFLFREFISRLQASTGVLILGVRSSCLIDLLSGGLYGIFMLTTSSKTDAVINMHATIECGIQILLDRESQSNVLLLIFSCEHFADRKGATMRGTTAAPTEKVKYNPCIGT